MKKIFSIAMATIMTASLFTGCSFLNGSTGDSSSSSSSTPSSSNNGPKPVALSKIAPTIYDVDEIVTADKTKAGSLAAWLDEVNKGGYPARDNGTSNSLIHSPFHTLTINGVNVPVYTARTTHGPHSFAWVDITSSIRNIRLEVELEMDKEYGKCVVLPESRGVEVAIDGATYTAEITALGSYSFTFAESADAFVTNPNLAPLTLMVAEEADFDIPDGYDVVEIEPGFHDVDELKFTQSDTVYIVKEGFHDISSIKIPEYCYLYLERGAYVKITDRFVNDGWNRDHPFDFAESHNTTVISRGLIDAGSLQGGDNKYKHVFQAARCENLFVEGVTVINSNTWTMCFYDCTNVTVERNLLLGFRTYSDGIMMSECVDSVGRYNFVRTGDDAIEFKATGWGRGQNIGNNCLYEYNDVWTDKATAYGLIWENEKDLYDMTFRHNTVGFAQPTWTDWMPVLNVRLGINPNARWGDTIFEDIEIYHVIAPNVITIQVKDGGAICENITFKNIRVKSTEEGVYLFRMIYGGVGSIKDIQLEDINFCGKMIKAEDKENRNIFNNQAGNFFKEVTIK